ncbi:hypothetical protein L8R96_19745 [Vibrio aestuarianus]|uniref:hypothetical protein n=1 Tax=Vibrio aestuarianus TaxID=28171 RepID=UPI00246907A5|nr:hypothetical protein [Vibrio aestuarianus]MDH5967994.1 hypothetical protein [Vibrio aestuarianus]
MPKYDHDYLEEDNEFYPAPSFPMTLKMKDEFKAFLFDCSKEELVEHAHQFLSIENDIVKQLQDWSTLSDCRNLANRMKIDHNFNSPNLQEWVKFLIQIATKAERMLSIDKKAMSSLASNDPGAYAQALLFRRAFCFDRYSVGDFTKNHLRDELSFSASDHALWLLYVERFPDNPLPQKIERVTAAPPTHPLE